MSLIRADARRIPLVDRCVQVVVTSPPYWGLRDYGVPPSVWGGLLDCDHEWGVELSLHKGGPHGDGVMLGGSRSVVDAQASVKDIRAGQFCRHCGAWLGCLGLEPTPELYVAHLLDVFAECWRVLKDDGVCFMNLGDCYATGAGAVGEHPGGGAQGARWRGDGQPATNGRGEAHRTRATRDGTHAGKHTAMSRMGPMTQPNRMPIPRLKPKDLVGIPWRAAFALQAAGWYLRSDIIWSKPNPMPESVTDRPTKAHEYIFLLTKSERYYYNADAIKEPYAESTLKQAEDGYIGQATKDYAGAGVQNPSDTKRRIIESVRRRKQEGGLVEGSSSERRYTDFNGRYRADPNLGAGRNKRSVWTVNTQPYAEAHFATFPEALVEPCILAGSRLGDLVFDPFIGSGTTGVVAERLMRRWVGTDLSYQHLAKKRTAQRGLRLEIGEEAS